jgi:hypothetical protein
LNDVVRLAGDLPTIRNVDPERVLESLNHDKKRGRQFTPLGPTPRHWKTGHRSRYRNAAIRSPIYTQSHRPKVRILFSFEEFYQHEKVK